MKKAFILLILICLVCFACTNNSQQTTLKGKITGIRNDTLYIYSDDELTDFVDTIYTKGEKFSFSLPLDTALVQVKLYGDSTGTFTLFLERGKTTTLEVAKNGEYTIEGNEANDELTRFNHSITNLPVDSISFAAGQYIHSHPRSPINIYLLEKYFVPQLESQATLIKELIDGMDGSLQDKPYIESLKELIEKRQSVAVNKAAPAFSLINSKGERINRYMYNGKYLLLTFWATWDSASDSIQTPLKSIYKKYPPFPKNKKKKPGENELAMLSISLDTDKTKWQEAIKQDTLKWDQVCDFTSFASPAVKLYDIQDIPYYILIDPRGIIISRESNIEPIKAKLKELFKKE